jgi:hypothetical protein
VFLLVACGQVCAGPLGGDARPPRCLCRPRALLPNAHIVCIAATLLDLEDILAKTTASDLDNRRDDANNHAPSACKCETVLLPL